MLRGRNFAKLFCPGAGNLTTLKNSRGSARGGCWCLELTDALCNDGSNKSIEDEVHFLFTCNWRKYKQLRENFFNKIINVVPNFGNLGSKQKFMYIISNENKTILTKFAIFVSLLTKEHEIAMTL